MFKWCWARICRIWCHRIVAYVSIREFKMFAGLELTVQIQVAGMGLETSHSTLELPLFTI